MCTYLYRWPFVILLSYPFNPLNTSSEVTDCIEWNSLFSVSKKSTLRFSDIFFPNGWEFLVQILRAYYTFLSTLDFKFLFSYLQLSQNYAILSATTQFISYAQNIHQRLKHKLCGRT